VALGVFDCFLIVRKHDSLLDGEDEAGSVLIDSALGSHYDQIETVFREEKRGIEQKSNTLFSFVFI
jgi:hypothetical protein